MIYAPFPGEFIASALRRGKEIQGIKNCRKFDFQIKRIKPTTRNGKWEFVLPPVIAEAGVSTEALQENTLYPLYSALGRGPTAGPYAPRFAWKICTECVIDDTTMHGSPYIHVCHLPKSIKLCHRHAIPLRGLCPACGITIASHNISDFIICSNSFPQEIPSTETVHQNYAIFAKNLLKFRGSTYSTPTVDDRLVRQYVEVIYNNDYCLGWDSYRRHVSKIIGMDFDKSKVGHHTFDLCLALAFLGFETTEDYIAAVQRRPKQQRVEARCLSMRF